MSVCSAFDALVDAVALTHPRQKAIIRCFLSETLCDETRWKVLKQGKHIMHVAVGELANVDDEISAMVIYAAAHVLCLTTRINHSENPLLSVVEVNARRQIPGNPGKLIVHRIQMFPVGIDLTVSVLNPCYEVHVDGLTIVHFRMLDANYKASLEYKESFSEVPVLTVCKLGG
jgi:hypothetical protein